MGQQRKREGFDENGSGGRRRTDVDTQYRTTSMTVKKADKVRTEEVDNGGIEAVGIEIKIRVTPLSSVRYMSSFASQSYYFGGGGAGGKGFGIGVVDGIRRGGGGGGIGLSKILQVM